MSVQLEMTPNAGTSRVLYVGDWIRFELIPVEGKALPGWEARLRTNLGRDALLRKETLHAGFRDAPVAGASWRDIPMRWEKDRWVLELPVVEPGWFQSKAYALDEKGFQHWPGGDNVGTSVHPDEFRSGNTIYCAFPRMFGPTKHAKETVDDGRDALLKELDDQGYSVIPPSGTLRDLAKELPHISTTLGCRYLHLLPLNPVPTTFARFGRFGSPYACQDLVDIDPALVEFDKRTTGVEQFCELADAAHEYGMKIILDVVINHTGWGSTLQEEHPEWFKRTENGEFESPGAWGTVWEDLVELDQDHPELWHELAEVFLIWLRRGVDGFRCDAGYMVPMHVWRFITARVREEFPNALFLLEGLGGGWEDTANLLTHGGMQWAYSELFQNYSGEEVYRYLGHALPKSEEAGTLIHYSETHDNLRLAMQGRDWSLHRNRLCALTSVGGGFGFTCGVEWLAPERVNVHSSRGLNWGSDENILHELHVLNRLIANHPCFFDGAELEILSDEYSDVLILKRTAASGESILVIANTDQAEHRTVTISKESFEFDYTKELLDQDLHWHVVDQEHAELELAPLGCCCFGESIDLTYKGTRYREARARAAWGLRMAREELSLLNLGRCEWKGIDQLVDAAPENFLGALHEVDGSAAREDLIDGLCKAIGHTGLPKVTRWSRLDLKRITPVPHDHWLMVEDEVPFNVSVEDGPGALLRETSIFAGGRHVAAFSPRHFRGKTTIDLQRFANSDRRSKGELLFMKGGPKAAPGLSALVHPSESMALMTNGIGGMARICVDLGLVRSKYDCVLGANLHPDVPVDRHIMAKRIRLWVNADGFISALNGENLRHFEPGPFSRWTFDANAGDGRIVEIVLEAWMEPGENTTRFRIRRSPVLKPKFKSLPPNCKVSVVARIDVEDRSFHSQTKKDEGLESHFEQSLSELSKGIGFRFSPETGRVLTVAASEGDYHPAPEWSCDLQHFVEQTRGHEPSGDAFSPGWFEISLPTDHEAQMIVTTEPIESVEGVFETGKPLELDAGGGSDPFEDSLLRALNDYVVKRDDVKTVIAGYPWFLDWGRDSLIAARGLLAAGMRHEVLDLLIAFGRFEEGGTLPNTIHGEDATNRDTSDAPLWYGIVCEEYARELSGNEQKAFYATEVAKGKTVLQVLQNIGVGYLKGTRNGIGVDEESGLVWSPSHFTWMDTNFPAGTPREGYPVEIQVMWVRLLNQLERLGVNPHKKKSWKNRALLAKDAFEKLFWLDDKGWYADCLQALKGVPAGDALVEDALRSNCLFAISLELIDGHRARRTVEAAQRYLIVPGAIRSLAPLPVDQALPVHVNGGGSLLNDPHWPYWGRYEGDEDTRRKPAYHNGTAWTWPFPSFCEAMVVAYEWSDAAVEAAQHYLGSMAHLLEEGCVGQIPEVLDGDAPHTQRGCDAQAWGVTEAIRVWRLLKKK